MLPVATSRPRLIDLGGGAFGLDLIEPSGLVAVLLCGLFGAGELDLRLLVERLAVGVNVWHRTARSAAQAAMPVLVVGSGHHQQAGWPGFQAGRNPPFE
jgi:hypothetical protein